MLHLQVERHLILVVVVWYVLKLKGKVAVGLGILLASATKDWFAVHKVTSSQGGA